MQPAGDSKLLRIAGAALYLLAAALFLAAYLSQSGVILGLFGMLAGAAGTATLRLSRAAQPESLKMQQIRQAWVLKPWLFVVGAVLFVPVIVSVLWMYHEATHGYTGSAFPLYMLAVSAIFFGGWWSAIYVRWQQRPRI